MNIDRATLEDVRESTANCGQRLPDARKAQREFHMPATSSLDAKLRLRRLQQLVVFNASAALLAFASTACGAATTDGWQSLSGRGAPAPNAEADPYAATVDGAQLAGHWVRISATVEGPADLLPLVHGFREGSRLSSATPRACAIAAGQAPRECSAVGWIPPGVDEVRIRWWNRTASPAHLRDVRLEVWQGGPHAEAAAQLNDLLARVRDRYAWAADVDWPAVAAALAPMTAAPSDESPLPQMAAALLPLLPRHEHMAVRHLSKESTESPSDVPLPSCRLLGGRLFLRLPGTPDAPARAGAYVEAAHACLRRSSWAVTLDLRESPGGDAQLMIAAAAPLLPPGLQLSYVNAGGKSVDVVLDNDRVLLGGQTQYRFAPMRRSAKARPVAVLLGPGCASACEALAVALRGQARFIGQPTAGLTTANEMLPLDADFGLMVTSGWMRDRAGNTIDGPIRPDADIAGLRNSRQPSRP